MSRLKLIELGRDFLNKKISVNEFVSNIVIARRESYGSEEANKDINHCAGELFIIADCFNPEHSALTGRASRLCRSDGVHDRLTVLYSAVC